MDYKEFMKLKLIIKNYFNLIISASLLSESDGINVSNNNGKSTLTMANPTYNYKMGGVERYQCIVEYPTVGEVLHSKFSSVNIRGNLKFERN